MASFPFPRKRSLKGKGVPLKTLGLAQTWSWNQIKKGCMAALALNSPRQVRGTFFCNEFALWSSSSRFQTTESWRWTGFWSSHWWPWSSAVLSPYPSTNQPVSLPVLYDLLFHYINKISSLHSAFMLLRYPTKMTIIAILQKALFYLNLAFSLKLINSLNFMKKYEFLQMFVWLTGYSNRCVLKSISEIENLESSRAQLPDFLLLELVFIVAWPLIGWLSHL